MRRKCYTNDTSAARTTRVRNFDFDNDTSEYILSHPYISYMANERLQREEQEEFCMKKRFSNIFKTKNVTKLNKVILKSCYRILQESIFLISCIIFEGKYSSGYILSTDQIPLSFIVSLTL